MTAMRQGYINGYYRHSSPVFGRQQLRRGAKMFRLVAAAVVAMAVVRTAAGEVASPREHHLPFPKPEAKLGQDFCNPIMAQFKTMLKDAEVCQKLKEKGFVKTSDTFQSSRGPVKAYIRLASFEIDNLGSVKRLGAGTLNNARNSLDCALKFPDLKIKTRYFIFIPRNIRIPVQRNLGSLTFNVNASFDFSAMVNSDGLLDELKSVNLRNNIAISNFNAPQISSSRYSSILTDIIRDTMDSAVARILRDTVSGVLEEILPNLTFDV